MEALWPRLVSRGPVGRRSQTVSTTEARQQPSITFSADVAPILYRHCVACHREGEMAPMPLTSFREVRPWARAIRSAVMAKDMPPWGATSDAGADCQRSEPERQRNLARSSDG